MSTHTPTISPELKDQMNQLEGTIETIWMTQEFEDNIQRHEQCLQQIMVFEESTGIPVYLDFDEKDGPFIVFVANEKVIDMPVPKSYQINETQYRVSTIEWTMQGIDQTLWMLPFINSRIEDRTIKSEPCIVEESHMEWVQ